MYRLAGPKDRQAGSTLEGELSTERNGSGTVPGIPAIDTRSQRAKDANVITQTRGRVNTFVASDVEQPLAHHIEADPREGLFRVKLESIPQGGVVQAEEIPILHM